MKKNLLFLSMAALVAASQVFTACSSDEMESQEAPNNNQANAISLTTVTYGNRRAASDPQSTQLSTAVKVGVYGIVNDAAIANGDNNQYSVEANGDLNATTDMVWPTEGSVNIYAYAPYQSGWGYNADNTFAVATNQTTEAGYLASDLVHGLPASNPVSQTANAVTLGFTHKLAKLNITIQQASDSNIDLTNGSVTIVNTKVATTFNPSTGAVGEATGEAQDIHVISALGTDRTACAIMVPQQVEAGTQLVKIIADGKQLIAKLGTTTTFVGGKSYNFTVKIGNVTDPVTEVTLLLGSTGIVNWDDEDLGSEPADGKLYASFGTPGGSATYNADTFTYEWSASTNNLMNCFSFANGELANYTTLNFTFTELTDGGSVRINVLFSDNTNKSKSYYTAGTKNTAISELLSEGKTAADVTAIRFGGNSGSGSTVIKASEMYLE